MYVLQYKDWNNQTVTVTIGCTENNDSELRLEADPVVLTEDMDDDPFLPVRCWSGYINIANCTPEMAIMLTSEPWSVEVKIGSVVMFAGYVRCESFTSALFDRPMSFQLPVECALSKLKRTDFVPKVEETNLLDLARECVLAVMPDATITTEPLNDGYLPSEYKLNKAIFCTWSEADLRMSTSKTLYDVLCACLLPIGYVARISGNTVTMKRYGHSQASRLENVASSFYGTNHTFAIRRPAKKVMVRATGCDVDEPRFTLEEAKVTLPSQNTFVAGGNWHRTDAWGNVTPYHNIATYRQNGRQATNLALLYRNDRNAWVGGGVVVDETVWGEFEQNIGLTANRHLMLTRSIAQKKGGTTDMTSPLARFRTTVPLSYNSDFYLKGHVKGMTEGQVTDYNWGNNCAGSIVCKIKYLNKWWTRNAETGVYEWSDTEGWCYVTVGEDGNAEAKDGRIGLLGMSESGFMVQQPMFADMSMITGVEALFLEVDVYGFTPINDDTLFCKIENLEIAVNEKTDSDAYKSHQAKLSDDGEDDYTVDLDSVSNNPLSFWGLGLGLQSVPIFEMAKARMNHPRLQMELDIRGGSFTPSINYLYGGKELTVMANELHVRDAMRKVKLIEVGTATQAMMEISETE